jgi:acyl-CoA synthetase (AMP-forming)/AMP-acid ligase II
MTLTFLISGILIILFASGLRLSLPPLRLTRVAIWLLILSGVGLIGLISPTDKTIRTTPKTWHGILHDSSFTVIGLTLMPAMVLLGFIFLKDPRWKNLAIYTWITVVLAVPTFWTKGVAFYFFLAAILAWCEVIALRLRSMNRD